MNYPSYTHGIYNLSATIAEFLGNKNNISKIEILSKYLNNNIKDVVFIIFDGLGVYDVKELTTNNNFYKNHIVDILSSTMPATTTAATTTLMSTKTPDEHLWLDWSLYLKEQNRVVEIYLSKDYHTGESTPPYDNKVECFLDRAKTERKIATISPVYARYSNKIDKRIANNIEDLFKEIDSITNQKEKHFLYCYCDEPDHTMHEFGVHSKQSKEKFEEIQTRLENLVKKKKDILIITTADHGHIDIKKYIDIQKDEEIMSLQARPLSMEGRFASFKILDDKQAEFKALFSKKYGKYFDLLSQEEVLKSHIFGNGNNTDKVKEFVGDFIAIGNESFYAFNLNNSASPLKGNHAGSSLAELEVPLCVFKN